jgi:chromosomal replication initiator protein
MTQPIAHLVVWQACLDTLQEHFPQTLFDTWLRPLTASMVDDVWYLTAPNRFLLDWVADHALNTIKTILADMLNANEVQIILQVAERHPVAPTIDERIASFETHLDSNLTFENFVEGNSNQLAVAASQQIAHTPGHTNNPLLIYGGVGLGKTHLMHAIGNILSKNGILVLYIHSEGFVADMVDAIKANKMKNFKDLYRNVGALLIDDIQFFALKERTQEEFFHTFNALMSRRQQIVMTCDRYPKDIHGIEERLKSRFGWGLTVAVEPPELETRVAILSQKAERLGIKLSDEVAFFIAKRVCSNVRELEGALKRVVAHAHFAKETITIELVKHSLRDLFASQDKLVTIDNILKTVAEYYRLKPADLKSASRVRSLVRIRQLAMLIAKELTSLSLTEIGDAFGKRDHTTVMHAIKTINILKESDVAIADDYRQLMRLLTA